MQGIIAVLSLALVIAGCTRSQEPPPPAQAPASPPPTQRANPASENCTAKGGRLTNETLPSGGQYGLCRFEDNRQCEEWALLRGECPVGGIRITGYATDAARYCAITGGRYTITRDVAGADEQGTCAFTNGVSCDAHEYYAGKCRKN